MRDRLWPSRVPPEDKIMSRKFTASFAAALTLGFLAVTAEAQQHRATRLGNPATRFAKPLKKADDLRVLLRADKMKADVAAVLAEVGWAGDAGRPRSRRGRRRDHPDPDRAGHAPAVHGGAQERQGLRDEGRAVGRQASRSTRSASSSASKCVRYRLVTPKACSNFWVEEIGKDTSDPKCAPPPPPPVVSVSGARETCVTQPVEYAVTRAERAVRQQGHGVRERQGARLRQAHERLVPLHVHGRA